MKKNLYIAFLILVALTLGGISAGTTATTASVASNEVVFTIPLGENGIHYADDNNPDGFTWGPPAFTVAPDGSIWIADTVDNRLIRFSPRGELMDKIAIGDFVVGAGDLEVISSEIWVLDMASIIPKVVQLSLDGNVLNTYDLPEGLRLGDGLSGIALGDDGSLLIEREGGMGITRLISHTGTLEQKSLAGYEADEKAYSFHPGKLRSKSERSHGTIQAGERQISVDVTNDLGSLGILRINPDGSFFAEVDEMVANPAIHVDQKVYKYDSEGNLVGMARVPLADRYVPVTHGIAVGPSGEVYALITKPDGAEVQRLIFGADLPPVLVSPVTDEGMEQPPAQSDASEGCQHRQEMIDVGILYIESSTYLDTYHIDALGQHCRDRSANDVPRYLSGQGTYPSVPYAWGMHDTVEQFQYYMWGGENGKVAGDINEPHSGCGLGVDCSGFVSNAWGLPGHVPTPDLAEYSIPVLDYQFLREGDIMLKTSYPGHVILFDSFGHMGEEQGMYGYEATQNNNYDRLVFAYRNFSDLLDYDLRMFNNVCEFTIVVGLPLIMNSTTADMSGDEPPPSPDLPPYPTPPYP